MATVGSRGPSDLEHTLLRVRDTTWPWGGEAGLGGSGLGRQCDVGPVGPWRNPSWPQC